jgi:hypothetical protein
VLGTVTAHNALRHRMQSYFEVFMSYVSKLRTAQNALVRAPHGGKDNWELFI